ncbi:MAG: hypothetical protein B6I28_01215 [Fusobacteriia bacterium 4572_132]|nr:MAG: hypothetical protein B6I28_01215 [Fusobacteriia bacterium 4572_132]
MENVKIDYNSEINQKIKGEFVSREVYTCFSYEMDSILKMSYQVENSDLPTWEDIENFYYFDTDEVIYIIMEAFSSNENDFIEYANNPNTFNRRVLNKGDFKVFLNALDDEELEELADEFNIDIDDARSKPHEIFEYWIISKYFYNKLKEKGYPVIAWGNNYYWGRCMTGQAILLDYVISNICEEMEILEGQKYSWAK